MLQMFYILHSIVSTNFAIYDAPLSVIYRFETVWEVNEVISFHCTFKLSHNVPLHSHKAPLDVKFVVLYERMLSKSFVFGEKHSSHAKPCVYKNDLTESKLDMHFKMQFEWYQKKRWNHVLLLFVNIFEIYIVFKET